jgi:hypothetical protein
MRRVLIAGLAFLGLAAFGPIPSDPSGPSTIVRIAEKNDFGWRPPVYNYGLTPDAGGARTLPLGTRATCSPSPRELSASECVLQSGDWGPGSKVANYNDGCGRNWTATVSCYKECQPREQTAGSPGQCMANNGTYGPGSQAHPYTNGCGTNWNVSVNCCVEGDVVTSASACTPNSGQFGPGNITKNHTNGCGRDWVENVSCNIPDPNPPRSPYDEILFCQDFEELSVRKMPFDFLGWMGEHRQYNAINDQRWDLRHSCAYRFDNSPPDTVNYGSPWYCTAWGHPSPSTGYCYMENPRFADFVWMNQIEKVTRDRLAEGAAWAGQRNVDWAGYGPGTRYMSPEELARKQAFGRQYDRDRENQVTGWGHPDNPQRVY